MAAIGLASWTFATGFFSALATVDLIDFDFVLLDGLALIRVTSPSVACFFAATRVLPIKKSLLLQTVKPYYTGCCVGRQAYDMIPVMFTIISVGFMAGITLIVLGLLIRLLSLRRRYAYSPPAEFEEAGLPTVTVCIPARNEVHAMTECLERLLASDYQKLEIIVLDDSSVDETSMLVKSFAHAGVRFVEGSPLPDGWLGKNHALEGLLEEASGKYVLFLDVDTILKPFTIRALIRYAIAKQLPLISVMPQREDGLRASVFLGTLRYFWTLILGTVKLPAVSGAVWLVDREKLLAIGGFSTYKNLARPEVHVAAALGVSSRPSILISSAELGVSYEKKWQSQVETSIRLLTPEFGGSGRVAAFGLLLSAMTLIPAGLLCAAILTDNGILLASIAVYVICMTFLSLLYFKIAWRHGWWLGALHWPYVVLQEAVLMLISGYKYVRNQVTWKGRPIQITIRSATSRSAE
jgi:chlorobactene glucosyltransferase